MLDTCGGFLLLLHNLAFGEVSELNGSVWFVAISVSRQLVSRYRVLNVRTRCLAFIYLQQSFYSGFQWTTGHLVISYHPLGSRLRLMLGLMDVLLRFGFSGRANWIWPLGSISDGSDGAALFCGYSCRLFSENHQCWMFYLICCNISAKQPISRLAFGKFRFSTIQFIIFSEVLIEDSNGWWDIDSLVLSFFEFAVGAVVGVGETSARVWAFGPRCQDLTAWLV